MAKFNPKKVAPATVVSSSSEVEVQGEVPETPIANLPKEVKGEGYLADFVRFAEQGFIGSSTTKE